MNTQDAHTRLGIGGALAEADRAEAEQAWLATVIAERSLLVFALLLLFLVRATLSFLLLALIGELLAALPAAVFSSRWARAAGSGAGAQKARLLRPRRTIFVAL